MTWTRRTSCSTWSRGRRRSRRFGPGVARGPAEALLFCDPRRFGGLWAFPTAGALRAARWAQLGPDALRVTAAQLRPRLHATRRPLKSALLDQHLLAGVGNIYADESLFRAGLHPRRPAASLSRQEVAGLAAAIRFCLQTSLAAGGSTLRDYRDADGRSGFAQAAHAVYGRGGLPCFTCGARLRIGQTAQRTTVHCPRCQR